MRFTFSGNMRRFVDFEDEIAIEGTSVADGLDGLVAKYPALKSVLFDNAGHMRAIHRLFVDGELLMAGDVGKPARPDAEVAILTPIAGG